MQPNEQHKQCSPVDPVINTWMCCCTYSYHILLHHALFCSVAFFLRQIINSFFLASCDLSLFPCLSLLSTLSPLRLCRFSISYTLTLFFLSYAHPFLPPTFSHLSELNTCIMHGEGKAVRRPACANNVQRKQDSVGGIGGGRKKINPLQCGNILQNNNKNPPNLTLHCWRSKCATRKIFYYIINITITIISLLRLNYIKFSCMFSTLFCCVNWNPVSWLKSHSMWLCSNNIVSTESKGLQMSTHGSTSSLMNYCYSWWCVECGSMIWNVYKVQN